MKRLAKPLRSAMKSRPNDSITPKDLTLTQSLQKSPNLPDAIQAFDSIAATSTSTSSSELDHLRFHNSLLQSYASVSNLSDAFSLLRHMVKASPVFKPDRSTYHILLAQSCVAPDPTLSAVHKALNIMSNAGFFPDKVSADIAVRTLVSAGRIESALQLFDEMIEKNTAPDDFTYNFLVKTLCKCRSLGTVHAFIDKTRSSSGPKPDLVTYTILIDNVCNSKNLREMTRLLGVLKDEGFRPDCFLYNTVMKGYCALSRGREAVAVFNEMKENGVSPDMITYNTLIYGLSRAGRAKEAKKYLAEMESEGFSPDVVTYTTLMNGLCRERDPLGAYALLNGMSSRGCEPNSCSYNTMLHGFCKAGMLDRAVKLFREMKEVGTEIQSVSYNVMVRNLCRKGMVAEAYEVFDYAVQSKSVTDVAAYVALEGAIKFVNKEREHGRGGDDWS